MTEKDVANVEKFLKSKGWQSAGYTHQERYRIITKESYPLPGAEITTGGKPRYKKGQWMVSVENELCISTNQKKGKTFGNGMAKERKQKI